MYHESLCHKHKRNGSWYHFLATNSLTTSFAMYSLDNPFNGMDTAACSNFSSILDKTSPHTRISSVRNRGEMLLLLPCGYPASLFLLISNDKH